MRVRLPIPATWQDFEALCHQLWKEIWADPNAQPNGRAGQKQFGVDIWGKPIYAAKYAGVQCKDKNGALGSRLTDGELIQECDRATGFRPQLGAFTMATTAARDASIQDAARALNARGHLPFDVHVWSWDDIEAEVACRPSLVNAFYKSAPDPALGNAVKIARSAPRDQFFAFFNRPALTDTRGVLLRDNLIHVAYELCDNAFLHGHANQVHLQFDGAALSIVDDGAPFDPLSNLDAVKVSALGNIGAFVFRSFIDRYADRIEVRYARVGNDDGTERNALSFRIEDVARSEQVPEVLDLPVDLSAMFGRRAAEGLAQSLVIPAGIKELVITVGNSYALSGALQFIQHLRDRLPASAMLTISYPRGHLLAEVSGLFDPQKVRFQSR